MGDVGLLCAACMDNLQFDLLQGSIDINLGSILENVIAQSLKCNGLSLYYFDSKKYSELDFVLQNVRLLIYWKLNQVMISKSIGLWIMCAM